jgi:hypothetical protein
MDAERSRPGHPPSASMSAYSHACCPETVRVRAVRPDNLLWTTPASYSYKFLNVGFVVAGILMQFDRKRWEAYRDSDHERLCNRFNIGLTYAFRAEPDPLRNEAEVVGLFLLLDKSYSAGLRRTVRDSDKYDSPVHMIIRKIYGHKTRRQTFLKLSHRRDQILTHANLSSAIGRVLEVADLLRQVNGSGRLPISFSSKFLYFRTGIVPIWDAFARKGLRSEGGRYTDYHDYALAIFDLLREAYQKNSFAPQEIKRLDNYLLWRGGSRT